MTHLQGAPVETASAYMPTNILLDALLRTRCGLKWGVPDMIIAAPYLLGAWLLTAWIADDGPGWLNLLVLLFIWNALRFVVNGQSRSSS